MEVSTPALNGSSCPIIIIGRMAAVCLLLLMLGGLIGRCAAAVSTRQSYMRVGSLGSPWEGVGQQRGHARNDRCDDAAPAPQLCGSVVEG